MANTARRSKFRRSAHDMKIIVPAHETVRGSSPGALLPPAGLFTEASVAIDGSKFKAVNKR